MQTKKIQDIHEAPRTVNDNAAHYGYVAFRDIPLNGSVGKEYWVQPDTSPFFNILPCRALIPFTNIVVPVIDDLAVGRVATPGRPAEPPVKRVQKSAKECASEMEDAYQMWVFKILRPLTGLDYTTAFHIFETIQPFEYKLKYLLDELEFGAQERIEQTEPYQVSYEGMVVELQPLPDELKAIAEETRVQMLDSAAKAVELGEEVRENTTQSMTQYFATGEGKRQSDPLDRYVFNEFEEPIPRLLNKEEKTEKGLIKELVDAFKSEPKADNSEILEELRRAREANAQMAQLLAQFQTVGTVTASTTRLCSGTNAKGEGCKLEADETGFCKYHK